MAKSQADSLLGTDTENSEAPEQVGTIWSDTVNISVDKLQVPFLTLMQANSKPVVNEVAKMGDWVIEGYPPMKAVTFVPMKFAESRRYTIEKDNELITACYSPGGHEYGIAKEPEGPGMLCAECPLAKWTATEKIGPDGKPINAAPLCKESLDFMGFCVEAQMPVRISFRSTGIKAGKLIAVAGRMKGLGNVAVELGSKKESGKMVYAIPTVTILDSERAAEALELGQMAFALTSGS